MQSFEANLLDVGKQLTHRAIKIEQGDLLRKSKPDSLVIVGMGGSGLPGEVLQGAQHELGLSVPLMLWKDYDLPSINPHVGKHPLFVFVSFSGNTEETISGLERAMKNVPKNRIAVITSGGKMKKIAETHSLPCAIFTPSDLTPRESIGIMFYGLTELLVITKLLQRRPSEFTNLKSDLFRTAGKRLSKKLSNRVVCIYTTNAYRHLGYIWKIKLNETGKILSFANTVPEMAHNEIVSFEHTKIKHAALFLEDETASPVIKKKIGLIKKVIANQGTTVHSIALPKRTILKNTWDFAVLADWTSYYLAINKKLDPRTTVTITTLKKLSN